MRSASVRPSGVPRRADLTSRPKRVVAALLRSVLGMYEVLKARLVVAVALPDDDAFYEPPEDLESYAPGAVIDSRPVDVRLFRRRRHEGAVDDASDTGMLTFVRLPGGVEETRR